jgi:hypothetical protein
MEGDAYSVGSLRKCQPQPSSQALSRKYGILDVSTPYRAPPSFIEIAFLYFSFTFIYTDLELVPRTKRRAIHPLPHTPS